MGMFDKLYISIDKLPISDQEKQRIGVNPEWQTKDLDCTLTEVHITDEGELKINRWNYKEVPKNERPYPVEDGLRGLYGSLRRENERLETIPHHGYINFYANINDEWYEFNAKFTDGKLESISGGKEIGELS